MQDDPTDRDAAKAPDDTDARGKPWSAPTLTAIVPVSETRGASGPGFREGAFYDVTS